MDTSKLIYPSVNATYLFTAIAAQNGLSQVRAFLNAFLKARTTVVTVGIAAEPRWLNAAAWTKAVIARSLPRILARSPLDFELAHLHPISTQQLRQAWADYVQKDLAYGSPMMKQHQSQQLLQDFLALFDNPPEIRINRDGNGWMPTTPCTFDITILAFSPDLLVILSFGDED